MELALGIVLATIAICAVMLFEPRSRYLRAHDRKVAEFRADMEGIVRRGMK